MKHLLSTADLDWDQANALLDTAEQMAAVLTRPIKKIPALVGRTIVNLFFEDSTRTRNSFELAERRLSADSISVTARGSSVSKGESMRDTMQTLEAMKVDCFVIRHASSGALEQATGWTDAHLVNAGDGWHEHPTQALLDAFTLRRHFAAVGHPGLEGKHVAIVGDLLHSRVVRSNVWLLHTLGATVSLVAPATLRPAGVETWPVQVTEDLDSVLPQVHALMMLRVQRERMSGGFFPTAREYTEFFGLTPARLRLLSPRAAICHPGPINRGVEISAEAADSAQSLILDQVAAGVPVRMSVLFHLLSGADEGLK
ncbi:MAG: aspartate carbamoyltransferase catalytic subunit [Propionibacteriaceae bacterium]|nr:aspartate carbamoyltransferase catalytic subunit [Propionibacteriaceae bacterium]